MTVEAYTPKVNWINTTLSSKGLTVDFENAKVLELYGNAGQLLADPENVVTQENYTVFEYSQDALDQGIEDFPNADFRMWDHHNQMNNPSGNVNEALPFSGDEKFDFIFCWMKTANLDPEILDSITQECYQHLNPGGIIMWGIFVREVALNYFIVRRTHEYGMLEPTLIEQSEDCKWLTLIDNDVVFIDSERVATEGDDAHMESTHFTLFWRNKDLVERLENLLPDATVYSRSLPPMWSIQNPFVIKKPE
jgi:SAM-dependent methyltransferase|tara:strand:- start:3682 stop:4431 length:750 start_codon:yes stop_codon:yes gene_type:complete